MAQCKFIYILCHERSGSTMLSYMLAASPAIVVPPELHLMAYPTLGECIASQPMAMHSLDALCGSLEMTLPDDWEQLPPANFYDSACDAASAKGIRWIIDKTPRYSRFPDVLNKTAQAGDPFYIWLARHPLGVLASQIERIDKRLRNQHSDHPLRRQTALVKEKLANLSGHRRKKILRSWAFTNQNIERFLDAQDPARQARVTYEQLVTDPVSSMNDICIDLSIETNQKMFNPSQNTPNALNWGIGDQKIMNTHQVDPTRAVAWRRQFTESILSDETRQMCTKWGIQLGS